MKKAFVWITILILVCALVAVAAACNKKTDEGTNDIDARIEAEGIALDKQEVLAIRGSSFTLTHTINPVAATASVTYTSDNPDVVQVTAAGTCNAKANGVATVTAKLDDSHYAQCRVIVGDAIVQSVQNATEQTPQNTDGNQSDIATPNATNGNTDAQNNTDSGTEQGNVAESGNADSTDNQPNNSTGNTQNGTDNAMGDNAQNSGDNTQNGTSTGEDNTNGANPDATATQTGEDNTNGSQTDVGGNNVAQRVVLVGTDDQTLFAGVQQALAALPAGKTILVYDGNYDEQITIAKNVTLLGVNNPIVKRVHVLAGADVTLRNLTIQDSDYPAGGEAAILADTGSTLAVQDCVIRTDSTDQPTGGYAILVQKQSGGVRVENNSIANFRYGIYVCPTSQTVRIADNRLSNMAVGIGLDLRQENAEADYPNNGAITGNEYNEVTKKTQFLHYGENYDGDFDFADNEEENASNGNSDAGGSGLLE